MPIYVRRSNGSEVIFNTSSKIGSGGEARIYEVASTANLVAKVYHTPTDLHARKLLSMLANPPDGSRANGSQSSIAWPIDLLVIPDHSHRIAGFLMSRVQMEPIIEFYHPKTRLKKHPLFHYGYLHRTGRNLASVVRAVHAKGYVIGDVNESNILANEKALVSIVDTDSFQVRDEASGMTYRCPVGKMEFTPPELQGQNFSEIDRSPYHDSFGLAVLLFQLLMEGTHPFAGSFTGTGEQPSIAERIKAGHFPYGNGHHSYSPGKHALPFAVLSPTLQSLFLRCFEEGHQHPHRRPDAEMWRDALENAEASLISCQINSQHLFGSHLSECPWCKRARQQGGLDSFPIPIGITSQLASSGQQKPLPPAYQRGTINAKSTSNVGLGKPLVTHKTPVVPFSMSNNLSQNSPTGQKSTLKRLLWYFEIGSKRSWISLAVGAALVAVLATGFPMPHSKKIVAPDQHSATLKSNYSTSVDFDTKTNFPVQWGPYTINLVKSNHSISEDHEKIRIYNSAGKVLWEEDADSDAFVSKLSILGQNTKELRVTPWAEGSGSSGTGYYFSRESGLHLLFSYQFYEGDDVTGFTNYDNSSRPEMQVDHSIVDFDGLPMGDRLVFRCVYKWIGGHYINVTAKFPYDAQEAERIAQAKYLKHWQEYPGSDYNGNDADADDSADRADAIWYWANAMAIGEGDTAKTWLLAHAYPRLASHLLQIKKDLQQKITPQGQPLILQIGDGKNLDQIASVSPGRSDLLKDKAANDDLHNVSSSKQFKIVPGHSVANVSLGSRIDAVQKMLGNPTSICAYSDGIRREYYSTKKLSITYLKGRTIEIIESDPKYATAEGISIQSTFSQIGQKFSPLQCNQFVFGDDVEADVAVLSNYTDLAGGITFSIGAQDDVLPSYKPEYITIDKPGQQPIMKDCAEAIYLPIKFSLQKDEFGYR